MTETTTTLPASAIRAGNNDRKVWDTDSARERLAELARSIEANGLAQRPTVRPVDGGWEIVCGERRVRAMRDVLGWDFIPVVIRDLDDRAASDIMLVENTSRADLDPIEEGEAYRSRMEAFGLSLQEVAEVAGVAWQRVLVRTRLLDLVPEAQHLVRLGQLDGSAWKMFDLDANRQRLVLAAVAEGASPKAVNTIIGRLKREQALESSSMFDAAAFTLNVEEYVAAAEDTLAGQVTKADLKRLVLDLAAALESAGTASDLVATARAIAA